MWVLLATCLRVGVDKKPATVLESEESCLVTIQQARSSTEKGIIVSARGGCLAPATAYLYIHETGVASLNLSKLGSEFSRKQFQISTITDLGALTNWTTQLPHEVNGAGTFPAPAATVCYKRSSTAMNILVLTSSSSIYVCDMESGVVKQTLQLCNEKTISSCVGIKDDTSIILYCLIESGVLYRIRFE